MHWFDIAVIAIALLSICFGLWRGLVRIAFSVGAVAVGLIVARLFEPQVARWLTGALSLKPQIAGVVAYAGLFLVTAVAIGVAGRLLTGLLTASDVNWINRLAGGGLGLAGGILVSSALYAMVALVAPVGSNPFAGSRLAPYVAESTRWIQSVMPPEVRDFLRREKEKLLNRLPLDKTGGV